MSPSPDLISELAASRPTAPPALRARIRELAARDEAPAAWPWSRLRLRRITLVAVPAALALAVVTAGVFGLSRSHVRPSVATEGNIETLTTLDRSAPGAIAPESAPATVPGEDRAQRVNATLVVEVRDSDALARAAQDAIDLVQSLGGHIVSSSVTTGDDAGATLLLRVPVASAQTAIAQLSALGSIVSQQVQVEDLQAQLDELEARRTSLRAQIARLTARLASPSLDPEARAKLSARRAALREELAKVRESLSATGSEASAATLQLTLATSDTLGGVAVPSRFDRTLDEALNVLAWEGIVALAVAIVLAPVALVLGTAWLGRRLYRRREDERLLAAS